MAPWDPGGGDAVVRASHDEDHEPGPEHENCGPCFKDKKRCSFSAPPPSACDRCRRAGRACTERDKSVSRRALERIKKQNRHRTGPPEGRVVRRKPNFKPLPLPPLPPPSPPRQWPPVASCPLSPVRTNGVSPPAILPGRPSPPYVGPSPSRGIGSPASTSLPMEPGEHALPPDLGLLLTYSTDYLVLPCVAHFWSDYHKLFPVIHRASFEAAFAPNTNSELYGPNPPLSLLFALAATGARTLELGLSDMDKARLGRAYCERSRDLLLAGYFGADPTRRPIGDLEALQTLVVLLNVLLGAGMLDRTTGAMLREAAGLVGRLLDLDALGGPLDKVPGSATDWIRAESALRAWIAVASFDVWVAGPEAIVALLFLTFPHRPWSYFVERMPLLDFFPRRPFRLPCHESYFDNPDPKTAFFALFLSPLSAPSGALVDFGPFFRAVDLEAGSRLVRQLVEPVFSGRASVHALWYLSMFFRSLRHRIRHQAVQNNVNPLATLGRPPSELTAAEMAFVAQTRLFDHMVNATYSSLPTAYAPDLWQGDAVAFLSSWRLWFCLEGHAFHAVAMLAAIRSYSLEHLFLRDGAAPEAGASLLHSPDFVPILEGGIAFVRLLASQLGADPQGRHLHFGNAMPAFRVAGMNLAAIAVLRASPRAAEADASPYADDLRVILRFMETVGKHYGVMPRRVADNFRCTLLAAGIGTAAPVHSAPQVEEVEVPSEDLADSGTFRPAADPSSPGRTYAELMTEADRVGRKWSAVP
ncbi:hypothetical protein DFJ74DRAFT_443524 [Hyaloraphidium curvatum]|nr:hypothetical protein DFJ74DRAFT_443524 [Hyaloraphidium curvatum]